MCGIIGIISNNNVYQKIIKSLKQLEYRGFDSMGVALLNNQNINVIKTIHNIEDLESKIVEKDATVGIGHTRWATHGEISEKNCHPIRHGKITIVHNGTVDNFITLKKEMQAKGYIFNTDTDTEIISILLDVELNNGLDYVSAMQNTIKQIVGVFAFVAIIGDGDVILGAKNRLPIILSSDNDDIYIASDQIAIPTDKIIILDDFDMFIIKNLEINIYNKDGVVVKKDVINNQKEQECLLENYDSYMVKEIMDQPKTIKNTIDVLNNINFFDLSEYKRIFMIGCGSSYNAALFGKYLFMDICKISIEVEIASEFSYIKNLSENDLLICISQSGETADVVIAVEYAKNFNLTIATITNNKNSTIAKMSNYIFPLCAGREISIVATKTFTAQLICLIYIAAKYAKNNELLNDINLLQNHCEDLLSSFFVFAESVVNNIFDKKSIFYIGKNLLFPISLESALKMKEITYMHAEAFCAGEIKHGPLAMIDSNSYVFVLAHKHCMYNETLTTMHEISVRTKNLFLCDQNIIDTKSIYSFAILSNMLMQVVAYKMAKKLNRAIDKPRNLAKSLTVI